MSFTPEETAYLRQRLLGRIATVSASGEPDVAVVRYRLDDGVFEVASRDVPATLKYRNVLANSRAAFVVDDLPSTDPWTPRGIKVHGRAEIGSNAFGPTIRIVPQRIWSWGINRHAEKYRGNTERRTA